MTKEKTVLSVDELAEVLGVSRPVAYQLVKRRDFPAVRVSARRIVIPVASLETWLTREAESFGL